MRTSPAARDHAPNRRELAREREIERLLVPAIREGDARERSVPRERAQIEVAQAQVAARSRGQRAKSRGIDPIVVGEQKFHGRMAVRHKVF